MCCSIARDFRRKYSIGVLCQGSVWLCGFEAASQQGTPRVPPCVHTLVSLYANSIFSVRRTTDMMKKGMRKVKKTAGRRLDKLRPASRSQSPAPLNTDTRRAHLEPTSSTTVGVLDSKPSQTAGTQPPAHPGIVGRSTPVLTDPDTIPPAPGTGSHSDTNAQAGTAIPEAVDEALIHVTRLASNTSLGYVPVSIRAHNCFDIHSQVCVGHVQQQPEHDIQFRRWRRRQQQSSYHLPNQDRGPCICSDGLTAILIYCITEKSH